MNGNMIGGRGKTQIRKDYVSLGHKQRTGSDFASRVFSGTALSDVVFILH